MLYFLAKRILNRQDATAANPEAAKRLERIVAERDEEYAAFDDDLTPPSSSESSDSLFPKPRRRSQKTPSRPERAPITLSSYESAIASEVIHPSTIPITFDDIGGLDTIIADLQESVIYPLTIPSLYRSTNSLLSAPSGVLLYGPPGCGKTMLAKALAHESGAVFINLHISTLTEKWYGDSNKLVAAVFSLARKLAPAIVFVDEIDAVLGTRRSSDHEASGMVKAEMMTHWDGLSSADDEGRPQQVLILGATNRPQDIDEAILRRMPKRFAVSLPNAEQRRRIFKLVLRNAAVEESSEVEGVGFDMDWLVKMSEGMSGSDIKECCREAAMAPMREMIQARKARGERIRGTRPKDLRGLRTEDFMPFLAARMGLASDVRQLESRELTRLLEQAVREQQRHLESVKTGGRRRGSTRKGRRKEKVESDEYESIEEVGDEELVKTAKRAEKT